MNQLYHRHSRLEKGKLTWVLAPLIPLVALVELPPMKLFLSSSNYFCSHEEGTGISYPCSIPTTQVKVE